MGLFKIHFYGHPPLTLLFLFHRNNHLLNNNSIISDSSPRDKTTLSLTNKFRQDTFNKLAISFEISLYTKTSQTYWIPYFGNKEKKSLIKILGKHTIDKVIFHNSYTWILFHLPLRLKNNGLHPFRPGALKAPY